MICKLITHPTRLALRPFKPILDSAMFSPAAAYEAVEAAIAVDRELRSLAEDWPE